jgi:hypothetical protein
MAARTVTITLSDDQERKLAACFGRADAPLEVDTVRQVVTLSLDAWLGVFSGARRYRSLTELYLDWLEQIYSSILTAAKPTSSYLYQRLNFSFGAASYLTRVLLSKEQSHWRDLARDEIRTVLLQREKEALEIIKEKGGSVKTLEFDLSKAARVELGLLMEALSESGHRISAPQLRGSFGDRAIVSLTAGAVPLLLAELGQARQP